LKHPELEKLAELIRGKNKVDNEIAQVIGRPAQLGHAGEFIAAAIFDIDLNYSATEKGNDGYFRRGSMNVKTVNIKWYPKRESGLDIKPSHIADFYLVLAGPKSSALSSRGGSRPWLIESVYLFDMRKLMDELRSRGVKIGEATSMLEHSWNEAEIYPRHNAHYTISEEQKILISLFKESA